MLFIIVVTIHILSCILLITAVLLQSGKDAGLTGAFGLGGGNQSIFGARAGDVLSKATVVVAVVFMATCILFTRIRPSGGRSVVSNMIPANKVAPVAPLETAVEVQPPAAVDAGAGAAAVE
jgi:preprotein translocase subunit SecG